MGKVRSTSEDEWFIDPATGFKHPLSQKTERHEFSDNKDVDTSIGKGEYPNGCGYFAEVVAICFYCSEVEGILATVCEQHRHTCASPYCSRTICPRHSIAEVVDGEVVHFCEECHEDFTRSRRIRLATRTIFSPFFEYRDDHE